MVTTPNTDWVPEFPISHSKITTFSDGCWGWHEYSQWPQQFAKEVFHIHCILAKPHPDGPHNILWHTLSLHDWKPDDCGVPGVGFLDQQLQDDLVEEVEEVIKHYFKCNDHSVGAGWDNIDHFFVICQQHTMDRLCSIPTVPGVIISLAAYLQ